MGVTGIYFVKEQKFRETLDQRRTTICVGISGNGVDRIVGISGGCVKRKLLSQFAPGWRPSTIIGHCIPAEARADYGQPAAGEE